MTPEELEWREQFNAKFGGVSMGASIFAYVIQIAVVMAAIALWHVFF